MKCEEYMLEQLQGIDLKDLVINEIRNLITKEVCNKIKLAVANEIETMIKEGIERIMSGGKIETNDGWGNETVYTNFEALFKEKLKERLDSTYEMKKLIDKIVSQKVGDLYTKSYKQISAHFAEKLLESKDS